LAETSKHEEMNGWMSLEEEEGKEDNLIIACRARCVEKESSWRRGRKGNSYNGWDGNAMR